MEHITTSPPRCITLPTSLRCILVAVVCVLLTGCYDTKQEITLNPDGTGKVVIESVFQQITPFLAGEMERQNVGNITNVVQAMTSNSEGVEAWRDISFHQRDDGRAFFRGTAYFRSLNKVKLPLSGNQRWSAYRDSSGNLRITARELLPPANTIIQTNETVTMESIRRERAQFHILRPVLQTTLGEMQVDITIHIPGTLLRSTNFNTSTAGVLRLQNDGKKTLAALEKRVFDTSLDVRRVAGEKFDSWDDQMMKSVYGEAGPVTAVIKPAAAPLFDYDKEVADARANFAATVKTFGLANEFPTLAMPATDGAPAKAKIIGVQWKQETGSGHSGYSSEQSAFLELSIQADLSGEVFSTSRVLLERAVTREGVQLPAQPPSWLGRPQLAQGRTNVSFGIRMTPPPSQSEGLAEVSGTIECVGPKSVRTMELITGKLRGGVAGKEYGVRIDDIVPNFAGGDKLLLRTTLKPEQLRSPRVIGDDGRTANLQTRKHESFGDEHVYTLANSDGIPRSGKVVAQVLSGDQVLRIPFSLTNVNWLGQPLK